MKTTKSSCIALFGALLPLGSVTVRAQAMQQAAGQSQADPNTAKKDKKETKAGAAADSSTALKKPRPNKPRTACRFLYRGAADVATAKKTAAQKAPPSSSAAWCGVNIDSGVLARAGMERRRRANT